MTKPLANVILYTTELLIEFTKNIYSIISLTSKYDNVDIDRVSTGPLEHTLGRSRVKCKKFHTIEKFIKSVGEINEKFLRNQSSSRKIVKFWCDI